MVNPDAVMDMIGGAPKPDVTDEAIRADRETPPGGVGTEVLEEQELDSDVILSAGADLDNAISTLTGSRSDADVAKIFTRVAERLSGGRGGAIDGGEE